MTAWELQQSELEASIRNEHLSLVRAKLELNPRMSFALASTQALREMLVAEHSTLISFSDIAPKAL